MFSYIGFLIVMYLLVGGLLCMAFGYLVHMMAHDIDRNVDTEELHE